MGERVVFLLNFQDELDKAHIGFDGALMSNLSAGLRSKRLSVAVVETCTLGNLSFVMQLVPDSNSFFLGGVTCTNSLFFVQFLGISPKDYRAYLENEDYSTFSLLLSRVLYQRVNADICISTAGKNFVSGKDGIEHSVWASFKCHGEERLRELSFVSPTYQGAIFQSVRGILGYLKYFISLDSWRKNL